MLNIKLMKMPWTNIKTALEKALNDPDCPISKAEAARRLGFRDRRHLWAYLFTGKHIPSYDLGEKFQELLNDIFNDKKAP